MEKNLGGERSGEILSRQDLGPASSAFETVNDQAGTMSDEERIPELQKFITQIQRQIDKGLMPDRDTLGRRDFAKEELERLTNKQELPQK